MGSEIVEEIQQLPSGQETGRPLHELEERAIIKEIYQASMENEWAKVQELYINNEFVHESKLTKSEDTALHLAISYYHPDRDDSLLHPYLTCIKKMISSIPERNRFRILKQKNEKGNTPLHLAAELGIVPIIECLVNSKDPTLIWETNSNGETPLFITSCQGNLQAFLYLHRCVQDKNGADPIALCRREDGDNILHAAISHKYFALAFHIIHYYPPLVNYYNTKGVSPLHVLSRMPQVFKRGSYFRFIDSIMYYFINIDEIIIKPMPYKPEDKDDSKFKVGWNLPENYQTLVEFLELLRYGTRKIRDYIIGVYTRNQENKPKDTANVNQDKMSQGHQSDRQYDPENPPIKDTTGVTDANQEKKAPGHQNDPKNPPTQAEGKRKGKLFPANYSIFIKFLKCLMKIVLIVLGIDYIIGVYTGNQENKPKDTTNVNQDEMSQGHQSDCQYDLENPPITDEMSQGHQSDRQYDPENPSIKAEGKRDDKRFPANYTIYDKWFPANYTIIIKFLKCVMKIAIIVLAIGLQGIKKFEERKRQHAWGLQIMKLLIEKERCYTQDSYGSTGEEPEDRDRYSQHLAPPTEPPPLVEDDKKEEDESKAAPTMQSPTSSTDEKKKDDHKSELSKLTRETPLLVASRMGIFQMVKRILKKCPMAIQETDSDGKNALLLAAEHRQTDVYYWLIGEKYPPYVYQQVDRHGNNAVHLAALSQKLEVWLIPGSALQLQGERKWYKYVKHTLPNQSYVPYNNKGQTPRMIFKETHVNLLKDGTEWIVKTANSCSVVAALIATVAFATAATIPGGPDEFGHPHFQNQPAFDLFSISSLVSLCCSVMALVFFLAILTSRCRYNDFEKDLPRKLHIGLTSLFASITAILVSFCAAHFFLLQDKFKKVAFLIYGATCIPVMVFAFNQFPLFVDLISSYHELPLRSDKEFCIDSSVESSSKQVKIRIIETGRNYDKSRELHCFLI